MKWLKIAIPVVTAGIMSAAALAYDTATATVASNEALAAAIAVGNAAGQKSAEAAAVGMPMSTIVLLGAGALAVWYFNKK